MEGEKDGQEKAKEVAVFRVWVVDRREHGFIEETKPKAHKTCSKTR